MVYKNYKYILFLYNKVNDFLIKDRMNHKDLPDIIVSFCIIIEKVLKIKLYNKNHLLVFEISQLKDGDCFSIIALGQEVSVETAKIETITNRFKIVFPEIFTSDEIQAIKDVYLKRNEYVHGYKSDDKIDINTEDIIKKMSTVWEKISQIAISLFGKSNIKNAKPKNKYSQLELEKALKDEVRKMITPPRNSFITSYSSYEPVEPVSRFNFSLIGNEKCPRCGNFSMSKDDKVGVFYINSPENQLYKCNFCHLELTEKQYQIAKEILEEKGGLNV